MNIAFLYELHKIIGVCAVPMQLEVGFNCQSFSELLITPLFIAPNRS